MNNFIDTRGITAAKSWSMIRDSITNYKEGCMTTITDNLDTANYIEKMAKASGIDTYLEETGGEYFIHMNSTSLQELGKQSSPGNTIVVITSDTLGRGEEPLGKALMKGYLYNVKYVKPLPKCIIFLNQGVRLTSTGSEVLEDLKVLCEKGIEIISSSACLEYYNLINKLAIGGVAGMRDITERMHRGENTLVL